LEIPHTTNFDPLLDLAKSLGVEYLNALYVAANASYRSEQFMQEVVSALVETVTGEIRAAMQASPFLY
jgi:hypothetical protein